MAFRLLTDRSAGTVGHLAGGGVAVTSVTHDSAELTTPLCDAIRTHCGDVTASIGVPWADAGEARVAEPGEFIDRLIDIADHAMYEAKRNSGNRTHLAPRPRSRLVTERPRGGGTGVRSAKVLTRRSADV
jgi:PleD family two-component response regulator